jgi:hypothetical protein
VRRFCIVRSYEIEPRLTDIPIEYLATEQTRDHKNGDFTQNPRAGHFECNGELLLKKSPSWCLRGREQQGYKQTRFYDNFPPRMSYRFSLNHIQVLSGNIYIT